MSDHYYSKMPVSASDEFDFAAILRGKQLRFTTDSGVFSKHHIDRGTKLLIENVPLPEEGPILDLGCGYGPVGLAIAASRPDLNVVMVDVNSRACDLARRNAKQNGLENAKVFVGDGVEAVAEEAPFTLIVSNPPYRAGKQLVYSLMDQAFAHLSVGGTLAVVGQTKQGIKSLKAHLAQRFENVEDVAKEGGYRVVVANRRT